MRLVVARGGNALLPHGEQAEAAVERTQVRKAASALAALARPIELLGTPTQSSSAPKA